MESDAERHVWDGKCYEGRPFKDFRKSYGYVGSVEYYPVKSQDFRVFMAYVGRKVTYKDGVGLDKYNTNRIELGFKYRIKAY